MECSLAYQLCNEILAVKEIMALEDLVIYFTDQSSFGHGKVIAVGEDKDLRTVLVFDDSSHWHGPMGRTGKMETVWY